MAAWWIANARLGTRLASPVAVGIEGERIIAIAPQAPEGAHRFDAEGQILLPAFTDAHVHLSLATDLRREAELLMRGGIAAVLDLGAPERALAAFSGLLPLQVAFAGPLLTAPGGYPTASWGADGYGMEIATERDAQDAVERVTAQGARVVKLAFDARFPVLDDRVAQEAATWARRKGVLVAAHALEPDLVRRAVDAGADVLAHAPLGKLLDDLIREIGARRLRVISTLHAYQGEGVENLRRLRAAGAVIAYGTDLGNEGTSPGIDAEELSLMSAAGLTFEEIVDAVRQAARLAGVPGVIAPGCRADLILVPEDALSEPKRLARPSSLWIAGALRPDAEAGA